MVNALEADRRVREASALTRYPVDMVRLSPLEVDVLPRFREAARQALGDRFVRVVLFGSRARGDSDEDSDVDLLVVTRGHSEDEERVIVDAATLLSLESDLMLSPLVREERWLMMDIPVVREIAREGVTL